MQSIANEINNVCSIFKGKKVRVVCFPLPPVPTKSDKIVYMPDSFMSRVTDKVARFNTLGTSQEHVLGVLMTENGPAVVFDMLLDDLLRIDILGSKFGDKEVPTITSNSSAICASVSFNKYLEVDGYQFVDKVSIDRLSFGGSCNIASHYVIPQAPHLSALIQYSKAPKKSEYTDINAEISFMLERAVHYVSPLEAEFMFPDLKWQNNSLVDDFVSKCLVDMNVSYYNALTGLGEWSKPYLKSLRHNHLIRKDLLYEAFCQTRVFGQKSEAVV